MRTKRTIAAPIPRSPHRTSGVLRSSWGIGRTSFIASHVEIPVSANRAKAPFWARRAMRITTTNRPSAKFALLNCQTAACSKIPMPIPAASAVGRLVIRATIAAAKVRSSSPGPAPLTPVKEANPSSSTRKKAATAERKAAIPQVIVESRRTGIPRRLARFPLSAAARIATP